MTETALRREICRVGASLYARGYVHSTAGNISAKLDDGGFLITPTDACMGSLDPSNLARLDANGQQIDGDRASKTIVLHRKIYESAPQARSIIHTHSTHAVALTLANPDAREDLLPPITPYFVMKVGHVPVIGYHHPGSPHTANAVSQKIRDMEAAGRPIRAVMLARLGPTVWAETPGQASAVLEELEETARLYLLTRPAALTKMQIDELHSTFKASW
ncbi:class II aldolase/adducin family protein [Candidimonas nitroreducens]|uniref:Aldolase n=1 Tax=Candidimonas nitroreducens TaxID=683354 RepID=A0A225M8U2_9BURK|nr:aldolase [Candidimonas nitroreducens]OWT57536.1 aldolase [Candidimonas nitroreducens]